MPSRPLSAEKLKTVRDLLAQHPNLSNSKVARLCGVSTGSASNIRNGVTKEPSSVIPRDIPEKLAMTEGNEVTANSWNIDLPKTRIKSIEDLVRECNIDLNVWTIDRFICNKWEVGAKTGPADDLKLTVEPLFQVKAFLSKKVAVVNARAEVLALKAEALKYSPKFNGFKPKKVSGTGIAAELSIFDHHFGALIWGKETAGADWDNKIAMEVWRDAFRTLMGRVSGYKPEMAIIPIGNDQQNADNRAGTTENLTPQSMDSRYQKVYGLSKEASRFSIDLALAEYGRVHVPIVPGNHDPLASWHLGDYLQTWYRNCPGVTIDNSVPLRKWWEWGVVMVMFEHGHKGKLPDYDRIMASENPAMWGRTKWREAHTGHIHHKVTQEQKGAIIRSLSSLRPACAWSAENHHTGSQRAAEAFVWCKREGLIGQATYSIGAK